MGRFAGILLYSLLMIFLMASFAMAADEEREEIAQGDLPPAVFNAFTTDYPEMEITDVETEVIDGVTYYEIECSEGEMDVIYREDGSLYSVEQVIDTDELPELVMRSLNDTYPDGEIEEAKMITKGSEISYEVAMLIENDEEDIAYEVMLTSDGKITSEDQITGDEDDDEEDLDDFDSGDEDEE